MAPAEGAGVYTHAQGNRIVLHTIRIFPAGRGYRAILQDRDLGVFDNPVMESARLLLDEGIAKPTDMITMSAAQTMVPITFEKLLAPRRPPPQLPSRGWRGGWARGESGPRVWRGPEGGLWFADEEEV